MAKVADYQNLSKEELAEKETQLKKQLMQLRFDAKLGKLEKHSTIKEMRRDIARVLTVANQQKAVETKSQQSATETKSQSKAAVGSKTQSKNITSRSAS